MDVHIVGLKELGVAMDHAILGTQQITSIGTSCAKRAGIKLFYLSMNWFDYGNKNGVHWNKRGHDR